MIPFNHLNLRLALVKLVAMAVGFGFFCPLLLKLTLTGAIYAAGDKFLLAILRAVMTLGFFETCTVDYGAAFQADSTPFTF